MLTKYGLESKYSLTAGDAEKTKQMNQGKGIFTRVVIEGKEYKLFDYVQVVVKVEMKGFHKLMKMNIV